ncbi:MAG TPA: Gfo/Idh/MocA family oxidoreductase [Opitutaceae bacterium]
MLEVAHNPAAPAVPKRRSRLGFVGVGWIGRNRLEAIARSDCAEVAVLCDPAIDSTAAIPGCEHSAFALSFESLLEMNLDGIVIATPSALHVEQAVAALEHGKAVFCQKPLARTGGETRRVIDAARRANRLLGVDLSYRATTGMRRIRDLIRHGRLGDVYAVEMMFHNAYGPDKPWFYDPRLSGGGCLLDLGIHHLDLALWCLGFPQVARAYGHLLSHGAPWTPGGDTVEDYAAVQVILATGAVIQIACSWRAPAGCDARIEATFLGTAGGASFRNLDGSYYHFMAEHFRPDRSRHILTHPSDDWSGRTAVDWALRLTESPAYDPEIEHLITVADTLDHLYGLPS